jgi:pimeloyl-ACP methyl ester carboxylesterase
MTLTLPRSIGAALAGIALAACTQLMGAPEPADGPRAITGPDGAIYVDDGGHGGLPVIFLHSFAGDSSHWASQLDHLRHHRRALAIDLRGHGKSARPRDGDYSIRAFVRDLEVVVGELKLQRFVLVGHSLGAAVANAYAGEHPRRVAGLVLVGAAGKLPAEAGAKAVASLESGYEQAMRRQMERETAEAQPHVRTQLLTQVGQMPREDAIAIARALFKHDPLPAFDRYKGPRLLLYASATDVEGGLHNARADARQKAFEGTSHWPHLDKPKEFNLALDEFLASIPASRPSSAGS